MLWSSRGWENIYKVQDHFLEIIDHAEKEQISSLVIDTLREQTRGQNIAVLYLYCDYQTQNDQSAVNMIGSLLSVETLSPET